jgi:hypothetical protein
MNTLQDWFKDAFTQVGKSEPEDAEFDVNFDPIAFVLQGRDSLEFSVNRKYKNKTMYETLARDSSSITVTDLKYATESEVIRKHFRNKIMMVSLRNHHVSPFRTALDEILLTPGVLKTSHIPILLRLPDFYQEDKDMETLIDNYTSSDKDINQPIVSRDETVKFVKKFTRYGRRRDVVKYFFKNSDNNLYVFKMETDNAYSNLMDFFANPEKEFGLRGSFVSHAETGYAGFNFYNNAGKNYEFY